MSNFYLIAGEASGDFIGGELMKSLPQDSGFRGVGGSHMQAAGLNTLFDARELSVMGFVEVLPYLFNINKRINDTVKDILACKPDAVITIDSPGFNFRVVKKLRRAKYTGRIIHYVAPTVWAYKPERAQECATLFDAMLCLLPFEPRYFSAHGLNAWFTGHPSAWFWREKGDGAAFRNSRGIADDTPLLGIMPGSREKEVMRHLYVFLVAAEQMRMFVPDLEIMVRTLPHLEPLVRKLASQCSLIVHFSIEEAEKKDAFAACNAAVSKSGTVALETVLAGIPTVTAYRANPLSVWLIRRLINIDHVHLVNVLATRQKMPAIIPELIQEDCTPEFLQKVLYPYLIGKEQQNVEYYLHKLLPEDGSNPSQIAANAIMDTLNARSKHQPI